MILFWNTSWRTMPGADGRPGAECVAQRVRGHDPDRQFFRARLLLALEGATSLVAAPPGLFGRLGQLFELASVGLAGAGRLQGGPVVLVGPCHGVSHPLSAASCGGRPGISRTAIGGEPRSEKTLSCRALPGFHVSDTESGFAQRADIYISLIE